MTRIVGARQTYMRSQFFSSGYALVVQVIEELHATKGWRTISTRKGKTIDRRTPKFQQEYVRARPQKKTYVEPPPISEKALMRHGWYRRKLRKESQLAAAHVTDADVF